MPVVELTKDKYNDYVNNNVIIDFSAEWCGPCKRMAPEFKKVSEFVETRENNLVFAKVDIEEQEELAKKFNVRSIPTLIILKCGEVVGRCQGARNASGIIEFINEHSAQ